MRDRKQSTKGNAARARGLSPLPVPVPETEPAPTLLPPSEVSVFVDKDGSITFSDLPADLAEIALLLDPDATLACEVPPDKQRRKAGKRQ